MNAYQQETIKLNNGAQIPAIGFGTYQIPQNLAAKAVADALSCGYRHIDCASAYDNQEAVGRGIKESGIDREDIFITSKVWVTDMDEEKTLEACEKTIRELNIEYLDLYLIHWPKPNSRHCYQIMQRLLEKKLVRSIGISNFKPHHMEEFIKGEPVVPVINQIECHPYLQQQETLQYCRDHNIAVTAHSPFMEGKMFQVPELAEIADKHHKSVAQVALRWNYQRGIIVIPKSVNVSRMKENFDIFNFCLDEEDMAAIRALETGERSAPDPDNMPF